LNVRGGGVAHVGISVGTATFGIDGETLDQLLVAADQAMYRTKSKHKLEKMSRQTELAPAAVVELDTEDLASVSIN